MGFTFVSQTALASVYLLTYKFTDLLRNSYFLEKFISQSKNILTLNASKAKQISLKQYKM